MGCALSSYATHISGVELSYNQVGPNQYEIQYTVIRDCSGIGLPSQQVVNYRSCLDTGTLTVDLFNSFTFTTTCATSTTCNGGTAPGYEQAVYLDTITLPGPCPDWEFYVTDCCKPGLSNLVNMSSVNSVAQIIFNNVAAPINSGPIFLNPAISSALVNQPFFYNPAAVDPDGDVLRFRLVPLLQQFPNTPAAYVAGLSATTPIPGASIDSITGVLTATPTATGIYGVAYEVEEYRSGVLIGTTRREITIYVLNNGGPNNLATDTILNIANGIPSGDTIYTYVNQALSFDIVINDPDNDSIQVDGQPALSNCPGSSLSRTSSNPVTENFAWTPTAVGSYQAEFLIYEWKCPLVVGFLNPKVTIIVLPNPSIISVYGIVAPDSSITLCSNTPSLIGGVDTSYQIQAASFGTVTSANNCITYQANSTPNVLDTIAIVYCDAFQTCDTNYYVIATETCVWAGDTDTSQLVNNFDLLPIGLGFGQTGTIRLNADLLFDCEPSRDWNTSTPVTNINYKHSDCDGNGVVNGDDTTAIVQNWGLSYSRHSSSLTGNVPIYVDNYVAVEGATVHVPIMLGDSTNPVDSAYGLAFTITYDPALVDSASVSVDFANSWFGLQNSDMISISKDFYQAGQIQVGITRIDQMTRNGQGQIGDLHLTIKDDIIRRSNNNRINLNVTNVRLISNREIARGTNSIPTSIAVIDTTVLHQAPLQTASDQVTVYPNPSNDKLTVEVADGVLELVELVSITGQRLASYNTQGTRLQLSTQRLTNGIYILQIRTSKGLQSKRILIQH